MNHTRIRIDQAIALLQAVRRWREDRQVEDSVKHFHIVSIPDKGE